MAKIKDTLTHILLINFIRFTLNSWKYNHQMEIIGENGMEEDGEWKVEMRGENGWTQQHNLCNSVFLLLLFLILNQHLFIHTRYTHTCSWPIKDNMLDNSGKYTLPAIKTTTMIEVIIVIIMIMMTIVIIVTISIIGDNSDNNNNGDY